MINKNCLICGNKFRVGNYRQISAKYCSNKCRGIAGRGKSPWCKGLKLPYNPHYGHRGHIPHNKQIKQRKNCLWCKKIMLVTKSGMINKKYCSIYCREKAHSKNQRGYKSHFWKGGLTPKNKLIRNSAGFCNWRKKVFKRNNYTCQNCGIYSGCGKRIYLEAHHIKSFAQHPELRFEISNGITLCEDCHHKTLNWSYKSKWRGGINAH